MWRTSFICSALAIISVFFYGSVEFGFVFNEIPKFSHGSFYNRDGSLEFWEKTFIPPGMSNRVDTLKSGKNPTSEFRSFLGKFISFFSVQSETMGGNTSKKKNNDADGPCDIFGKNVVHNFPILVGFIITIVFLLFKITLAITGGRKGRPSASQCWAFKFLRI